MRAATRPAPADKLAILNQAFAHADMDTDETRSADSMLVGYLSGMVSLKQWNQAVESVVLATQARRERRANANR